MLSRKEKEEMLEDGRNSKRRKDFAKVKEFSYKSLDSLDEYIQFLTSIQKVSPFQILRKKTISKFNKL